MSDELFTLHRFQIFTEKNDEPVYLIPFGDVHRDCETCHEYKWLEFLEWAKNKKNCYFIGMGDYTDMLSFSERTAIDSAKLHSSTRKTIDMMMRERARGFAKEIEFMKGKLVGLLEGNHHGRLQAGFTTTQYMCEILDCKYLGVSSFIRLSFDLIKTRKKRAIDMFVHHGKGASRLVGGSLNTVQQMVDYADADIYLMGHDHKKSVGFI